VINHGYQHLTGESKFNLMKWFGLPVTFLAVVISWVLFRSSSIHIAMDLFHAMWSGTFSGPPGSLGINRIMPVSECFYWLSASAFIAFLMPNAYKLIGYGVRETLEIKMNSSWGGIILGMLLTLIVLLLAVSETRGVSEFLYFNF
jgi:hypothetical protein